MEPLWHSPLTGEKHFLQLDDMCGPMAYLKVALIWPLRQLNQFARKEKKEEHHHFLDGSTAIQDKNESPFLFF
jgi:hypothetical protein